MTHDEIVYRLAITLMLKGSGLPAFLETLPIRDRVTAVKALDEVGIPMGDGLYEIWITSPGLFAKAMDANAIAELDRLADLARATVHAVSLMELAAIAASMGDPEALAKEDDRPKDIIAAPTETTRSETVQQVRKAGEAGLN